MREIIEVKAIEFENMIKSVPSCELNRGNRVKTGKDGLNIVCRKGVKIPSAINKWGMVWKKTNSLELIFDFPVGLFSEKELIKATNLPTIPEKKDSSYVKLRSDGDKWDSVHVRLFSDCIEAYSFTSFPFQKMFHKIVFHSTKAED